MLLLKLYAGKKYGFCESHSFDYPLPSYIACGDEDSAVNIIFINIKCCAWNKKNSLIFVGLHFLNKV